MNILKKLTMPGFNGIYFNQFHIYLTREKSIFKHFFHTTQGKTFILYFKN